MFVTYTQFLNESARPNRYHHLVEYTVIGPGANVERIREACELATKNHFAAVCVVPEMVGYATGFLRDTPVKVVAVLEFPDGAGKTRERVLACTDSAAEGAWAIDVAMDFKLLSRGDADSTRNLRDDVRALSRACHDAGTILRMGIQAPRLTADQILRACEVVVAGGADGIVTSTGAECPMDKVSLMRRTLPDWVKMKAAGGIRTNDQIVALLRYCDRVGTSTVPGELDPKNSPENLQ